MTVVLLIAAVIVLCVGTGGILGAIALGALLGAAIGGITGGVISAMMGGSFWEGFVNGAFIGAIGGMISGGMGFALAGKAALTLGQTFAVGAASGSGVSLVNDIETILIGGELSLGEVIRNMLIGGTLGAIFAGIGYGMSKAFAALKVKFAEVKGASGAKTAGKDVVLGSGTKSAQKLSNQISNRGWTETMVRETVDNPYTIRSSLNKATGNVATVFYTQQGSYVIVDDITNAVVQVSDNVNPSTWMPDSSIVNPYIPK